MGKAMRSPAHMSRSVTFSEVPYELHQRLGLHSLTFMHNSG
jgi:hypothetical protein